MLFPISAALDWNGLPMWCRQREGKAQIHVFLFRARRCDFFRANFLRSPALLLASHPRARKSDKSAVDHLRSQLKIQVDPHLVSGIIICLRADLYLRIRGPPRRLGGFPWRPGQAHSNKGPAVSPWRHEGWPWPWSHGGSPWSHGGSPWINTWRFLEQWRVIYLI
jgi:hypothetical protein